MSNTKEITDKALESSLTVFIEKLNDITDAIAHQVIDKAPKAAELMLNALQLRASLVCLFDVVMIAISVTLTIKVHKWHSSLTSREYEGPEFLAYIVALPAIIFSGDMFLVESRLIMALSPASGLALQVFDKIIQ